MKVRVGFQEADSSFSLKVMELNEDFEADVGEVIKVREVTLQSKTVTPSKSTQEVKADAGYTGLESVTVSPIPRDYIIPSGTKTITENGTHDATAYASVSVNVPSKTPVLQEKTVTPATDAQTVAADSGYDGLSKVTVNAMPTANQALPTITVDNSGLILATAEQQAGYVVAGTRTGMKQLTTQAGKTVTPSKSEQTVVESGIYTTGAVKVAAIPDSYIQPSGSLDIDENGTHNVKNYASVNVNVPIPDGYLVPSGTLEIAENGTHDVTQFASVNVDVPSKEPILQEKTATENGEVTADSGYDGLSKVIVNVESGGGGSTDPDYRDLYQRVEYITSATEDTYPYIITDIYADNSTGAEVIASFSAMADRIPMGSRQDSSATRFYVTYPLSTTSCYYGFNIGSSISCSTKVNTVYRLQTNFMNSRQAIIYEESGTRKAFGNFTQTLSKHTVPIAIFGYNSASSGAVTSKREYKLYSARISYGFDVIREYIPCYRKSDGEIGLYEKFTGQFLVNADTDGDSAFAKGADVDW